MDTDRVIIAGFGPVGRALAEALAKHQHEVAIIDTNPRTVRVQQALGRRAIHGDVSDPRTLEAAELNSATALIVTIPDAAKAIQACRVARALAPSLFIAVRTEFASEGIAALQSGADSVTVEEIAAAESLAEKVLGHMALDGRGMCEGAD